MHSQNIPFLDLVTPHVELEQELTAIFQKVIRSAGFIGGPLLEAFEKEFAAFCHSERAIAVNSGTDALRFALMAAGVKAGDIVVTVPHTFIATTEAISQAGAEIAFVDIDERTYNMDPVKLENFLNLECEQRSGTLVHRKTGKPVTAVVPVHLYGQMADMDAICGLVEKYNLILIEDACQAHGAEYFSRKENRWKKAGSIGRAAAFSFYPGKNLGACGEAGAITTNDAEIDRKCRMLRDHGQAKKYYHDVEGYNGRLDAMQAGFLSVKLKHLPEWNEKRRQHAERYRDLLGKREDVILPHEPVWSKAVYHLFVIRVADREQLKQHLEASGIGTGIHYPIPLHLQKAYAHGRYKQGDFPVTERVAAEILSLPMFPGLTEEMQVRVADQTTECISRLVSVGD
ncbi:MAG: DegT/DnrJ/EryC1/StrS family aminotransferase [Terriglobales bacterium]